MKIVVVNYGMGNIYSVQSAISFLGFESEYTDNHAKILNADKIILPGVGSYRKAMQNLLNKNLDDPIRESILIKKKEILGICLGMQLLGKSSTEDGFTRGLNLFDGTVDRFKDSNELKVPHIGYNEVFPSKNSLLFRNLNNTLDFYFVHSYKMQTSITNGISSCSYGVSFVAAFENENIFGTQFHPEKSQTNGLVLLKNFLSI